MSEYYHHERGDQEKPKQGCDKDESETCLSDQSEMGGFNLVPYLSESVLLRLSRTSQRPPSSMVSDQSVFKSVCLVRYLKILKVSDQIEMNICPTSTQIPHIFIVSDQSESLVRYFIFSKSLSRQKLMCFQQIVRDLIFFYLVRDYEVFDLSGAKIKKHSINTCVKHIVRDYQKYEVSDQSKMIKKLRSLTSPPPRQKSYSLTSCIKHIHFYLVRDYTKNMRYMTSQTPRPKLHSLTTCVKHINFYLVRDYTKNMRCLTSH